MKNIHSCTALTVLFLLSACLSAGAAATPGITLSVPANPVTIKNPGQYNLYVTITPHNGFTGAVSPTCTLIQSPEGARNLPICQESTLVATIPTISGPDKVTFILNIVTAGIALPGEMTPTAMTGDSHIPWLPFGGGVLACAFCFFFPKTKRNWMFLLIPLLAAVSLGLTGCGSDKNLTTPGNYTFQVTAASAANSQISASTKFTVMVQ